MQIVGRPGIQPPGPPTEVQGPLRHTLEDGRPAPWSWVSDELSVNNLAYEHSCSVLAITLRAGARYLVFRDAQGAWFKSVRYKGVDRPRANYTLTELEPGGPMEWLAAIEQAIRASRAARPSATNAASPPRP